MSPQPSFTLTEASRPVTPSFEAANDDDCSSCDAAIDDRGPPPSFGEGYSRAAALLGGLNAVNSGSVFDDKPAPTHIIGRNVTSIKSDDSLYEAVQKLSPRYDHVAALERAAQQLVITDATSPTSSQGSFSSYKGSSSAESSPFTDGRKHDALNMPIRRLQNTQASRETLRARRYLDYLNAHYDDLLVAMDDAADDYALTQATKEFRAFVNEVDGLRAMKPMTRQKTASKFLDIKIAMARAEREAQDANKQVEMLCDRVEKLNEDLSQKNGDARFFRDVAERTQRENEMLKAALAALEKCVNW